MNHEGSGTFAFSYEERTENERVHEREWFRERHTECVYVCVSVCVCVREKYRERGIKREPEKTCVLVKEYACCLVHFVFHPDPFQVHCIVSLIYVAPHLHLSTMSTLWKIYSAVHIICDDISALMNAFSSISLNKMSSIQPIAPAIRR